MTLFGVRFSEAIRPGTDSGLCTGFKTVPKGKDYLAMKVTKLESLYEESGSHERGNLIQLTLSGIELQQSTHLFGPCPNVSNRSKSREESCRCERAQHLILMFK